MKLILSTLALIASVILNAKNKPVKVTEQRVKLMMDKLMPLQMDKITAELADSAFTNYYRNQDKDRENRVAIGEQPDREIIKAMMQQLIIDRDNRLKNIFTVDQYKKWKDEIEPTLRPQRPGLGKISNSFSLAQ